MAPPILTSPPTNESSDVLGPYPTLILAADGNKTIPIVQALWATRWCAAGGRPGLRRMPRLLTLGQGYTTPVGGPFLLLPAHMPLLSSC